MGGHFDRVQEEIEFACIRASEELSEDKQLDRRRGRVAAVPVEGHLLAVAEVLRVEAEATGEAGGDPADPAVQRWGELVHAAI